LPDVTLMTILSLLSNKWILGPFLYLETLDTQHICSNTVVRTSHLAMYRQCWWITLKHLLVILGCTRTSILTAQCGVPSAARQT
jgi:hypothetical protein